MTVKSIIAAAALAFAVHGTVGSAEEIFGFEMQIGGAQGKPLQLVLYRSNTVLATADFTSGSAVVLNVPYALAQRVTRFCVISDKNVAHFSDGNGGEFEATCDDFNGRSLPREAQNGYKLTYSSTLYE